MKSTHYTLYTINYTIRTVLVMRFETRAVMVMMKFVWDVRPCSFLDRSQTILQSHFRPGSMWKRKITSKSSAVSVYQITWRRIPIHLVFNICYSLLSCTGQRSHLQLFGKLETVNTPRHYIWNL